MSLQQLKELLQALKAYEEGEIHSYAIHQDFKNNSNYVLDHERYHRIGNLGGKQNVTKPLDDSHVQGLFIKAHWNDKNNHYSVKPPHNGSTLGHIQGIHLGGPDGVRFEINESGRQRALREGQKNPHSFVSGIVQRTGITDEDVPPEAVPIAYTARMGHYFVLKSDYNGKPVPGQRVDRLQEAYMLPPKEESRKAWEEAKQKAVESGENPVQWQAKNKPPKGRVFGILHPDDAPKSKGADADVQEPKEGDNRSFSAPESQEHPLGPLMAVKRTVKRPNGRTFERTYHIRQQSPQTLAADTAQANHANQPLTHALLQGSHPGYVSDLDYTSGHAPKVVQVDAANMLNYSTALIGNAWDEKLLDPHWKSHGSESNWTEVHNRVHTANNILVKEAKQLEASGTLSDPALLDAIDTVHATRKAPLMSIKDYQESEDDTAKLASDRHSYQHLTGETVLLHTLGKALKPYEPHLSDVGQAVVHLAGETTASIGTNTQNPKSVSLLVQVPKNSSLLGTHDKAGKNHVFAAAIGTLKQETDGKGRPTDSKNSVLALDDPRPRTVMAKGYSTEKPDAKALAEGKRSILEVKVDRNDGEK